MAKIIIEFGGRKVAWEIGEENAAVMLQTLVQSLGPAEEIE